MAGWMEILSDRTKYPDDMVLEHNGEKYSVKELRDQMIPKADFTRVTQEHGQRQTQLEQQLQQAQAQLAQAIRQSGQPVASNAADPFAAYREDPAFGPFVKVIDSLHQQVTQLEQRTKQHEQTWWTQQHLSVIQKIQEKDKALDVPKLLAFAQTKGYPNLQDAYDLMTLQDRIKHAETEAEKRGYEKAKNEPRPPVIPDGLRVGVRPEGAPAWNDSTEVEAMNDPAIHAALAGGQG
jgi:hypothetical protein